MVGQGGCATRSAGEFGGVIVTSTTFYSNGGNYHLEDGEVRGELLEALAGRSGNKRRAIIRERSKDSERRPNWNISWIERGRELRRGREKSRNRPGDRVCVTRAPKIGEYRGVRFTIRVIIRKVEICRPAVFFLIKEEET